MTDRCEQHLDVPTDVGVDAARTQRHVSSQGVWHELLILLLEELQEVSSHDATIVPPMQSTIP